MGYRPIDRAMRYPIWFGLVLLSAGFALHYLGVQAVRDLGVSDAALFELTPIVLGLQLGGAEGDLLGAQLFVGAFRAVYATVSTLGLLMTLLGFASIAVGLGFVRRRTIGRGASRLRVALTDPRQVAVLAALVALVLALVVSPLVRTVFTNAVAFTAVAGPVFALSRLSMVRVERRAGPAVTVLVVGPLAVATVLLSAIAGAFASPATVAFMQRVTSAAVQFLLATVFAALGVDTLLVRVFELEGPGFLAFWAGVDVVLGVALGAASLRYGSRVLALPDS